jgi:hypothetical protein
MGAKLTNVAECTVGQTDRQAEGHNESNRRFLRLCKSAYADRAKQAERKETYELRTDSHIDKEILNLTEQQCPLSGAAI